MPDSARMNFDSQGGLNTVLSPDLVPQGQFCYLQNTRRLLNGRMTARPPIGANLLSSTLPAGVTSVTRLNDPYASSPYYVLIEGAAGVMYVNAASVATGLSSSPLSFLPYRPSQSPQPWCYIGDPSLAVTVLAGGVSPGYSGYGLVCGMLKVRSDGTVYKVGVKEPQVAPSVATTSGTGPNWVSYRYTYRSSKTGAVSNPSPESDPQIVPQTSLSATQLATSSNIIYNSSQYEVNGTELRTKGGVSSGTVTDYIIAQNLGFSIPTGVNVDGVLASTNWLGQYSGTGIITGVALFYQGQIIGDYKAPGIQNSQSPSTATQGGDSDNWGTVLTPTIVNDPTFGIGFQVTTEQSGGSDRSFFINFTATVYYTILSATTTATPSIDPQVDTIDYYRMTPTLDNFTYVGSTPNTNIGFVDTQTDLAISSNPILSYENYEPFPSIDLPRSGICNVTSTSEDVTGIDITTVGSGQTDGTYIIPSSGGGGVGATVQVIIFGGIITSAVVLTPGSGYTTVPSFIVAEGGTPGTLTATIGSVNPGTLNVSWVSGDHFNVRWLPGNLINIDGIVYTLYNRPSSTTELCAVTTTTSANGFITYGFPPAGTDLAWSITVPTLAAEPSPVIWGPTPDNAGSFYFGLDPNNQGDLLWSLGNNFDSAPDTNRLYVTSPNEPLMNGTVTSELSTVFSTDRFWLIYPNFADAVAAVTGTLGSQWTLVQSASTRGLYMRYAIGALGSLIGWRAKDGIFVSQGGGPEQDISGNIFNLFPHSGQLPSSVTIGGFTVYPPDDTKPNAQTIVLIPGYIFYNYQDTTGTPRTLVYDMEAKGWNVDVYHPTVNCHSWSEGDVYQILVGGTDGTVRQFDSTATESSTAVLSTPCINTGDARAQKILGDIFVKALITASNPVALGLYANRYSTVIGGYSPTSLTGTGLLASYVVDITSGYGDNIVDVEAQISWPVGSGNILEWWEPSWAEQLPDSINDRSTQWMDLGGPGSNYVRGLILEANTFNAAKSFAVEDESGTLRVPQESPITLNGQQKIGLSFNPPFVSHIGRIVSSDGVPWMRGPDADWSVEWISDPYPEITKAYTPIMEISGPDNKFMQGVKLLGDTANSPVTFQVLYDGGQTGPTFTGTFNGKQTLVFSWTPFLAHDIQLVPQANARIWYGGVGQGQSEWCFQPFPESLKLWQTELTSLGGIGFQHLRLINIEYISTASATLSFVVDTGNGSYAPVNITIPSSGGTQTKWFTQVSPNKWKLISFKVTSSAPITLFQEGFEVWTRSWGSSSEYSKQKPFAGPSASGAIV